MLSYPHVLAVLLGAGLAAATAPAARAQSANHESHIAIPNPAGLSKAEAVRIYRDNRDRMADGYALSRLKIIEDYQAWQIFNVAPYVSATHGQRYVNSYANETAKDYGTLKDGETLPPGSVLAKDSITVTDDGRVFPGAMFIMEKLTAGTSPETADWRYVMVIPDGSLHGDTTGDRPELVTYCHECHVTVKDRDYTFYVPEDYRTYD